MLKIKNMKKKKITKKRIIETLKTYNVTEICKLYKEIYEKVPESYSWTNEKLIKHLNAFIVFEWAKKYAKSDKMERNLYKIFDCAGRFYNYPTYERKYKYSEHGEYEPLPKQEIVEYLMEQIKKLKENPESRYVKWPIKRNKLLLFCSMTYKYMDYNKWVAIKVEGNERFVETIIKYADKIREKIKNQDEERGGCF